MLIVKVELLSAITGERTLLGEMAIANIGGTDASGNYKVGIKHKSYLGFADRESITKHTSRTGEVLNHPRKAQVVWRLVLKALKVCYPEHVND